ncbi:hypothetical protein AHX05_20460 [Salmonella enterica subsp. indica]|uniref:Uncharacterized protein n=1 Tax=Salmonella enterica TaxID=28901 RepID=A0A702E4U0_SALER|nr:hypothetical protein [Salmonella enterica subsp. indica]EBH9039104.1 hypothetical protein [Salmonella enterica subsp. indica serovar 11:b:e,n,x]HAC6565184.1 hypothetical protein [Salmonella enterica subsp. indica]
MAGLYLNDDLLNGALMSNVGDSLIRLHAVKGPISSVGGRISDTFWCYIRVYKSGAGRKPTLGLLPLSRIRDAR